MVKTRYPAYDRELLAISANFELWVCYMYRQKRTTVYIYHTSLQHILAQNKLTSYQWRHLDRLQQHDYKVKYFPGAGNIMADAFGRNCVHTGGMVKLCPRPSQQTRDVYIGPTKWLDDTCKEYEEDAIFRPVAWSLNSSTKDENEKKMT